MTHPLLRLDFYPTAVLMTQWNKPQHDLASPTGACLPPQTTTYPVSIHDVATACTKIDFSSGFLPPNTLFWQQRADTIRLGIYVPARRWHLQTAERTYHLPLPPLIFVGAGTSYQIFAVKKRPLDQQAPLFYAPCPNVYSSGSICAGNTPFPVCTTQTIHHALTLFMEGSHFNADLSNNKCRRHPHDVRQLWAEIDGKKRFPLGQLVPMQRTLSHLL